MFFTLFITWVTLTSLSKLLNKLGQWPFFKENKKKERKKNEFNKKYYSQIKYFVYIYKEIIVTWTWRKHVWSRDHLFEKL